MKRRPHASWHLAVGSVGVMLGAGASLWLVGNYGLACLVMSVLFMGATLATRSRFSLVCICVAGICFGLWRGASVQARNQTYDQWFGKVVLVTGRITEDPEYVENGVQFQVGTPTVDGVSTQGRVWVRITEQVKLKRSYEITIRGKLSDGFGTIPATLYEAQVVNVNTQKYVDTGRDIRDWFSAGIAAAVPGTGGQLGSGILLGQKNTLPERLEQDLLVLGLTHIVVASGYNLTILVKIARKLAAPISRFTALVFSVMLIVGFLSFTGVSPSMSRASLVAGLSLAAWYYGRKTHPIVILACTGGATVAVNPTYAWGDLGWMLSFLSFIGVLIVAPLTHAYFWGQKSPGMVRGVLVETASAQVMTLPLLVYVFGHYSPLSVLANLLIVPLIPLLMVLIFAAGVVGVVAAPIAWVFGLPASSVLWYYTQSTQFLAGLSIAQQELQASVWAVALCYGFGLFAVWWLWKRTKYDFYNRLDEWI